MDFTFTEDQLLFQDSVADFLRNEVTPDTIRARWNSDSARDTAVWSQLAELGLTGITVPGSHGGLGMTAIDFVLLAQECGYVALPEPLVHTALVAAPALSAVGGELADEWLPRVATGEAIVVVAPAANLLVEDAHIADLLLLERDGVLLAATQDQVALTRNESVDPSRCLFSIDAVDGASTVDTAAAADVMSAATDGGALGAAAQALGLAQRMIDMTVQYSSERQQFGKPIGSFQAVKHHMANAAVKLEYARAPVHRAAYSIAHGETNAAYAVSHAKLGACEAANLAAKHAIQVHGAMGYTWEVDLHIFMKRAWVLANAWGDAGFHKRRIADQIFAEDALLGAGATFA